MEGPNRQKNGQFSSRKYTRKSRKAIGPDGDHNPTDLHEIPDPAIMVDQLSPVNKDDGISMVVFDLETTGFGKR